MSDPAPVRQERPRTSKPTHRIKALSPKGASGEVGVAWLNKDQSVSIKLNVGVVLRWDDQLVVTAFPLPDDTTKETL